MINGSLWTIPVELAFYAFLPILYRFGIDRLSRRAADLLLGAFAFASFLAFTAMLTPEGELQGVQAKLLQAPTAPPLHVPVWGSSSNDTSTTYGTCWSGGRPLGSRRTSP